MTSSSPRPRFCIGSRVRFRSTGQRSVTFRGRITGYDALRVYAFIIDDGRETSRPVSVERILGHAMGGEHVPLGAA